MTDAAAHAESLKSLHTALIDSRNGYQEALDDAKGKGLSGLFREMIDLRNHDAAQLAQGLRLLGEKPDQDGSFMTTVHRAVIKVITPAHMLLVQQISQIGPGERPGVGRIPVRRVHRAFAAHRVIRIRTLRRPSGDRIEVRGQTPRSGRS